MRNMPKSDVRLVIFVALLLISWFFHTIQQQKHDKAVKFLKFAILNSLNLKNGGTKQTMELFRLASEQYDQKIAECKFSGGICSICHTLDANSMLIDVWNVQCFCAVRAGGDKHAGKGVKMLKDPLFATVVDKVRRTCCTCVGSRLRLS
jgi:hypothetical protein